MATQFESVPNVTRVVGNDNEELVTQKLLVTDECVTIMARGGVIGGPQDIELSYDEIETADYDGQYTYDLVLETPVNTYTVTNVSADEAEISAVVEFIRSQCRDDPDTSRTASDGSGTTAKTDPVSSQPGDVSDSGGDAAEQLRKFAELRDDGIISDEEFERKKRQLLE